MGLTALLTNASRGRTRGAGRCWGVLRNFLTPSTQSFPLRGPFIPDKDGEVAVEGKCRITQNNVGKGAKTIIYASSSGIQPPLKKGQRFQSVSLSKPTDSMRCE